MMSYPTEAQKGMFISIFWAIFNLGGVVGSAISFGSNFNSTVGEVLHLRTCGRSYFPLSEQQR